MKAIIVAAGMGRRLGTLTDDRPKCMVEVSGRSILSRQLDALAAHGIDDVLVVRGYMGDRIRGPGLRFCENPRFRENNILASLLYAGAELDEEFVFSYSDIVFHPDVVERLLLTPGPLALVVDRRWAEAYEGRTEHPIPEAELTRVEAGLVQRVGKRAVEPAQAAGEFIGLARFGASVGPLVRAEYARLEHEQPDAPFGDAPRLQMAYLTDMINHLIGAHGLEVRPAYIDGQWREIDTTQDLERAHRVIRW